MSKSSLACRRLVGFVVSIGAVWGVLALWQRSSAPTVSTGRRAVAGSATATTRDGPATAPAAGSVTQAGRALFAYGRPVNAAGLDAILPAPARAIHYVRLNLALIAGKQSPFWQSPGVGRLEIPLPDGSALGVVIDESEMLGADRFTSSGHLDGRPLSRALFAYHAGFLHASIEDPDWGKFALRTATGEWSQFYRLDPALIAPCGGGRRPVVDGDVLVAAAADRARQAALAGELAEGWSVPDTAAAENAQRAEVHLLMLHTPALLATLTGAPRAAAIQNAFDAAILKVNNALAASQVSARVKLVRIAETNYAGDGLVDPQNRFVRNLQDTALTALQSATDGSMDEIHALRDQAGADVVCLVLNRQDAASVGLSYVLERPGQNHNALYAFSVVEYASLVGGNVLPHELGHVFGCSHDRPHATSTGSYPYSYGYAFFGADGRQYRDIMSYPPGTELSYYSTPKVVLPPPISAAIGIAPGVPGEADAARTIEQNAFEASAFRLQTQAAANGGALINVSTRGYVGVGEQVMIGGFVVNGTQPKKVLVRGAGPSLANYGVAAVLNDPVLSIYSAGTRIAFNDNWSGLPEGNAVEVRAAAKQVGAFDFIEGSNDAGLVVTLPPAAYTAIVEGSGGTTGTGLVEVYEVERSGGKVVNLSTRAYADRNGKEMFGGFVVQGAAGTTKRILIRVLGPTLSRGPLNRPDRLADAMEDPFLAIYNAAGDLLIQNDDWSTGSEGGVSAQNDFRPTVRYYSEKQIAATGFAPANRREPCVMVDLAPGLYTVIASPFELVDPNPAIAQAPKPGVGIVEVYEINP
ncbi:MAG: hypothetical protein RIQ93_2435 [Verrucomicrobiota bacterium]|jgi:hypothetical protein